MSVVTTLNGFINTLRQFLEAMADTYEDCSATQLLKTQFLLFIDTGGDDEKKLIIGEFNKQIAPFCDDIVAGDLSNLKGIEMLDNVRFDKKWKGADDATRACITEYVQTLCKFAQTYSILSKMPGDLMKEISSIAEGVANQVKEGRGVDLSGFDLQTIGEKAQKSLDPMQVMQLAKLMATDPAFQTLLTSKK